MWFLLASLAPRAADLVVDGTTVVLVGTAVYDEVRVVNGGRLVVGAYDGATGGTLALEADRTW